MTPYFLRPLLLGVFFIVAGQAGAATLTTPSFVIEITENCGEGNIGCDNVSYVGTSKKSGNRIQLRGKTVHALCADGVTPCRFLGYEFKRGAVFYSVSEEGQLTVTQGKKILVQESGSWD